MPHEIVITVKPGGEIETEVHGIKGPTCRTVTSWLDKLGKVIKHYLTKEADGGTATVTQEARLTTKE